MHFIGKELVEDRPALFPLHRAAVGPVAQAVEEIVPFQLEIDVVLCARPAVKGGDEMQQHLVAVCNQERPVHAPDTPLTSTRPALTPAAGVMSRAAAH